MGHRADLPATKGSDEVTLIIEANNDFISLILRAHRWHKQATRSSYSVQTERASSIQNDYWKCGQLSSMALESTYFRTQRR